MKLYWLAALAAFFMIAPFAGAINPPVVTFIPSQISVNSSFLMIADPNAPSSDVSRVNWVIYGIPTAYGDFTNLGNKWIYYVLDTNLFPSASYGTPYSMEVTAVPKIGSPENSSINISVGGIPISSKIDVTGNTIYVQAWVGGYIQGSISYTTYYVDTLDEVPDMSGTMTYNPNIFGYTAKMNLSKGEYFMAFTASSSTDFGGGVARFTVGGSSSGQQKVSAESIVYNPVINAGQPFTLKRFTITNTGTENLTSLSISVPPELSSYIDINPEKSSLQSNESTLMVVTLSNIQSSMNISTFATLYSGSTDLYQIPVELRVSVIDTGCTGKADGADCLGGICCGEMCRKKANCCGNFDCTNEGDVCTNYQCVSQGSNQTTDIYCSAGSCRTGGGCYSDENETGETCLISGISGICCLSQTPSNECLGISNMNSCNSGSGKCCSESCISGAECCSNDDCTGTAGETCSDNICTSGGNGGQTGGIDVVTIALIGGGIAAAAVVGFFLFKKFRKKGGGEEELGSEEEEFSDEDFY